MNIQNKLTEEQLLQYNFRSMFMNEILKFYNHGQKNNMEIIMSDQKFIDFFKQEYEIYQKSSDDDKTIIYLNMNSVPDSSYYYIKNTTENILTHKSKSLTSLINFMIPYNLNKDNCIVTV